MYHTYLFDFDYTLADASRGIADCFVYTFTQLNYPIPPREALYKSIGLPMNDAFTLFTGVTSPAELSRMRQIYRQMSEKIMTAYTVLYPESTGILAALHNSGKQVGIVSSKTHRRIAEALHHFALTTYVDIIIGSEDITLYKPNPAGILAAITKLHAASDQVLYTGDNIVDAQAAYAAGVYFSAVTTGTTAAASFADLPHKAICADLSEWKQIFLPSRR